MRRATPTSPATRARPTSRPAAPAADTSYGGGVANPSDGVLREAGTDRRVPLRHLPWRQRLRLGHRHRGRHAPATSTSAAARRRTAAASRRPPAPTTLTANSYDAFLSKFDAAGTRVYSTFFGGTGGEQLPAARRRPGRRRPGPRLPHRRHLQHRLPDRRTASRPPSASATPTTRTSRSSTRRRPGRPGSSTRPTSAAPAPTWAWASPTPATGRSTSSARPTPASRPPTPSMPTYNGGNSDVFVAKFDTVAGRRRVAALLDLPRRLRLRFPWDVAVDPPGRSSTWSGETRLDRLSAGGRRSRPTST